jgi:hypothetical protein
MGRVVTILEGQVATARAHELRDAYSEAGNGPFPPGLISSTLMRSTDDPTVWRVQTHWASHDHLLQMRAGGKPRGVQMFEAAGAVPTLTIFEVIAELTPSEGAA